MLRAHRLLQALSSVASLHVAETETPSNAGQVTEDEALILGPENAGDGRALLAGGGRNWWHS
jgi:hypothetical protein